MSVAYLVPTPPPVYPETEAYRQEIQALLTSSGGRVVYINPNRFLPRHCRLQIPRPFFGFLELPMLLATRHEYRLVQIYSPTLYRYPLLRAMGLPVVYNLTGGCVPQHLDGEWFDRLGIVTVATDEIGDRLRRRGIRRVRTVRAGIETSRFTHRPLPVKDKFHLLMASAPWTEAQFAEKGVDALLEAMARDRSLRLSFLLRGVLSDQMARRIRDAGVEERAQVLDGPVDMNEVFATVHATANLATTADVVKAYPHSLMESLAAGKPVLVSRAIPMSQYVEDNGVGQVVEEVTAESIGAAVAELRRVYRGAEERALEAGQRDFPLQGMTRSFLAIHDELVPEGRKG